MEKNTIDEAIADAMAEEEVKQEQDKQFKEELRNALRENFSNFIGKKDNEKITISVEEYLILNNKSKDLDRLIKAIVSDLSLNYSKNDLVLVNSGSIINALKVLYPDVYVDILDDMLKNEG